MEKAAEPTSISSPILFAGFPKAPSPEMFAGVRKNNPLWYQILEQAYKQFAQDPDNSELYPDPEGSGATLEQIWRLFTLFGRQMWCVLAQKMPPDQISGIARLFESSPAELISKLKRLQAHDGQLGVTTLHYDRHTGHCVTLLRYDEASDRFIYYDPWPENSLLSSENNMAGVEAQPEGTHWSVTADELERVIFASFLFPHQHARLEGIEFDILYDTWKSTDFYSFFHLKLLQEQSEKESHHHIFQAGPFKRDVNLAVDFKDNGKITKATLLLTKPWIAANAPLAIDIATSFIRTFAPPPDRDLYDEIGGALRSMLREPGLLRMRRNEQDSISTDRVNQQASELAMAFLSATPKADIHSDFALLYISTMDSDLDLLELDFHLL